jgi:hypothetical protein
VDRNSVPDDGQKKQAWFRHLHDEPLAGGVTEDVYLGRLECAKRSLAVVSRVSRASRGETISAFDAPEGKDKF